jgi:hypothetical protein
MCSHSKIAVQLWHYTVACLPAHLRICTSTKTLPCMCMHSDACMRACASPSHTETPTRARTRYRPEVRLRGVRIHLRGFPGGQWLKEERGWTERRGGGSEPARVLGRVCAQVGGKEHVGESARAKHLRTAPAGERFERVCHGRHHRLRHWVQVLIRIQLGNLMGNS